MKNLVLTIIASFVLIVALISMLTPIPGGTLMIALSITSLTCTSPRARSIIQYMREKNNFINKMFFMLEDKVGSRITIIGDALKLTQPDVIPAP
jgi:hypothetical protein